MHKLSTAVVALALLAGCSSGASDVHPSAGPDAGGWDAPSDVAADRSADAPPEAADARSDAVDASADASTDSLDASADASTDSLDETADDAAIDDATADATGPVDPAPGIDTPGSYGGEDCPTSPAATFTIAAGAASSYTFTGTVSGQLGDGVFYVHGPNGEEVGGALETSAGGAYQKTLPLFCGVNIVKLRWTNEGCPLVLVYEVNRTTCESADITVTVQWDALGRDWELHLIEPAGHINDNATDCTWTSCIGSSPDWGVVGDASDNPHKDIDNTGAYGPENIWLSGPVAGTYTVMVEHWAAGSPDSSGFVTLNVKGVTTTVAIQKLAPQHVWTAATIAWPSGTVTTTQDIYDCSGNWSSGCKATIP